MRLRLAILAALHMLLAVPAPAAELSPDLRVLTEGFQVHRRTAAAYLRNNNPDLGAVEVERLQQRWAADRAKLLPATLADTKLVEALTRTETFVADGAKAIEAGQIARAGRLLGFAAEPLAAWRASKRIRVFSDCIAEISSTWRLMDRHRQSPPNLRDGVDAARIESYARMTAGAVNRCNDEADDEKRADPEFRRLIDGMLDSLRQVSEALAAHDGDWLLRLLLEQRSIDQLLSFRYG